MEFFFLIYVGQLGTSAVYGRKLQVYLNPTEPIIYEARWSKFCFMQHIINAAQTGTLIKFTFRFKKFTRLTYLKLSYFAQRSHPVWR